MTSIEEHLRKSIDETDQIIRRELAAGMERYCELVGEEV